jgi:hypothetical protein
MLLLIPLGLMTACGDSGDNGADVPTGYKRVESGGLRFVVPTAFRVDDDRESGDLFVASPPGTLARQPRVVGTKGTSFGAPSFASDVANLRDVNTTAVGRYTPVSDGKFEVPGSDEGYRIVTTFDAGVDRDVPSRRVLIVARKGTTVYQLAIVIPDAKRGSLDADLVARSLELT